MKNLIATLIAVMMCCTTAMATENNTKSNNETTTEQKMQKQDLVPLSRNDVPTCTASAQATYSGSGTCNGNPYSASSTKTASCSGADCQAAYACAEWSAYLSAMNDVNSIMELCNN